MASTDGDEHSTPDPQNNESVQVQAPIVTHRSRDMPPPTLKRSTAPQTQSAQSTKQDATRPSQGTAQATKEGSDPAGPSKAPADDFPQPLEPFPFNEQAREFENNLEAIDAQIDKEWENYQDLMSFFGQWIFVGQRLENERSKKRLKTQGQFIKKEEMELKKLHTHQVGVVKAFTTALGMLSQKV